MQCRTDCTTPRWGLLITSPCALPPHCAQVIAQPQAAEGLDEMTQDVTEHRGRRRGGGGGFWGGCPISMEQAGREMVEWTITLLSSVRCWEPGMEASVALDG